MARPLCERVAAGSPGTLGTQEQVVGGVLAVALPPTPQADEGVPSARRAQSTWPQWLEPNPEGSVVPPFCIQPWLD